MSARHLCLGLMLLAVFSCHGRLRTDGPQCLARNLTLTLTPRSTIYTREDAANGAVRFVAEIRNPQDHSVIVAHPTACWPNGRTSINLNDRHGKSEILLEVTKPDGQLVVLRDGPHWFEPGSFEPGSFTHRRIPPNGKLEFAVAWFFDNARGRWQNDDVAATLFLSEGEYAVAIVFRNVFRCALEPKPFRLVDVWTGEMRSAPVKIVIK